MGQFRVSLPEVIGVKFDRSKALSRLLQLGIGDPETLTHLLDEMEAAHTRDMFMRKISQVKEKNYHGR